jgi:hypothetical protein
MAETGVADGNLLLYARCLNMHISFSSKGQAMPVPDGSLPSWHDVGEAADLSLEKALG